MWPQSHALSSTSQHLHKLPFLINYYELKETNTKQNENQLRGERSEPDHESCLSYQLAVTFGELLSLSEVHLPSLQNANVMCLLEQAKALVRVVNTY